MNAKDNEKPCSVDLQQSRITISTILHQEEPGACVELVSCELDLCLFCITDIEKLLFLPNRAELLDRLPPAAQFKGCEKEHVFITSFNPFLSSCVYSIFYKGTLVFKTSTAYVSFTGFLESSVVEVREADQCVNSSLFLSPIDYHKRLDTWGEWRTQLVKPSKL